MGLSRFSPMLLQNLHGLVGKRCSCCLADSSVELLIENATGALGIAPYNISWIQHCRTDAQESLASNSDFSEFDLCKFGLAGWLDSAGEVQNLGGG